MSILRLENVQRVNTIDSGSSLSRISFEAEEGEIMALTGESGSGVATLLRIIAGLERFDAGNVYLAGKNHGHKNNSARKIGMVFQGYALFPNLTLLENVKFGLEGSKKTIEDKAKSCLNLVGLKRDAEKYSSEVKIEDQFRTALARAIASQPDLLLLNEPFSGLRPMKKSQFISEIRELIKKVGITTVLDTSDKEVALSFADRVAIFHKGYLQQLAVPQIIYQNPVNSYVANFFGKRNEVLATATNDGFYTSFGFIDDERSKNYSNKAKILFRPEEVKVKKSLRQALIGTVRQCSYFGDHQMVTLEDDLGKPILVKSSPNRVYNTGSNVFFTLKTFNVEDAF